MPVRTQHINESDLSQFVDLLGSVFEASPWVAEQAYLLSPFTSRDNLYDSMVNIVRSAPQEKQRELLCRQSELGARESARGLLGRNAKGEKIGASLDQCSRDELARIEALDREYRDRFGYAFIIAMTDPDKLAILRQMEQRLQNPGDVEHKIALAEVEKIAWIRISTLVDG